MSQGLRLATRTSALALAQAGSVAERIGAGARLVHARSPDAAPGPGPDDKARFVRGVEAELQERRAELGVHSAKDLPGELPEGLAIVGVPEREDPADVFVGPAGSLDALAEGARVGTASLRRRSQLLALRPDLEVVELRGNVDTRLRKVEAGEADAAVLARAGLARLGREDAIAFELELERMTPAAGQGALALEARQGDEEALRAAAAVTDPAALAELTAERAATAALGATCDTPVGVCARLSGDGERLRLIGYVGLPDGSEWLRDELTAPAAEPASAGADLAERMTAAGAREILERAEAAV